MITIKLQFKCKLCNHIDFYVMPLKEKIRNDFINSMTKFNLQCKKCGKNYILSFNVKVI